MSVVTSSVSCIMQWPLLALAEEGNLSLEEERQRERETETKGEVGDILFLFVCLFVLNCFVSSFHFVLFLSFVLVCCSMFCLFNYIFVLMCFLSLFVSFLF